MRSERIGHFTSDVEAYLCTRDIDPPNKPTIDVISCPEPVCNQQLKKMWDRSLTISSGTWFWKILDYACRFWTSTKDHHISLSGRYDDFNLFKTTTPHLSFTKEEIQLGHILLEQMGIPEGAKWICIHNRDGAYLNNALGSADWEHHSYRDFSVKSMVQAAEELSQKGYYIVRMGAIVEEELVTNSYKVIDYASSEYRSEFADIYLLANCNAYIGSDAGIACVPLIFRKPLAYINHSLTLLDTLISEIIYPYPFITKHIWHKEKRRYLSLREIFELGLMGASETLVFKEAEVNVIENKPCEIRDLAIEVDERLKGIWRPQSGDEELQQQFWSIYRQHARIDMAIDIQARVCSSFLKDNTYLLN